MEEELQQAIQLRAQNNFLAVQTPSSQLRQQQEQGSSDLKNLQLKNISGLTNIGATCYMNSVLQTLFMTPEFRKNLYAWKFNDEEYVEQDCIPYQLQKLFAKMQTQFSDFIDTKELIKSFQWNEYQEFEQHDVQEFIKKLFNAIEDTMQGTEKSNFIKDLYQGVIQSYVKCSECGYESIKEQVYNDIIITVKNIFDKIYNESLEKGLQRYLKPEILEGDNAYQCSQCNKKVKATMGVKFNSFPKIMTIILNRFTYDFFTMQRIKLNDYVSFPFILNLNNYKNGYDGIKNKLPEENIDPKYFDNDYIIKPTVKQINDKKNLATKPTQAKKIYEKKVNGRTQSTSDFIKKMRQQNKSNAKQQDFIILEKKNGNENINEPPKIINFSENGKQNNQNLQKNEQDDQNTQENKKIQQESKINAQLNQQSVKNQQLTKNINGQLKKEDNFQQQQQQEKQQQNEIQTNSMKQKILNDSNEIREKKQNDENNEKELSQEEKEKIRMQKIKEERIQFEKELLEAFNKKQEENEKLIEQYKKEGELVYELYSVLVHSGGAYGGHYYVLIKNFQDKQWYSFNDTRVTQFDLRKFADESQGGNNKNAYMLFYRQIEEDKEKEIRVFEDDIPDYIKQILAKDKEKLKQQVEMEKQKSQLITVRVYYKLDVKLITLSKKQKYNDLLQQALQIFKLEEINQQNARIRAYKPQQDLMQEVYTGKEEKTLEDLKIGHFKNICIEIKNDEEQFEDYDENQISLKICLWNDKYVDQSLEESNLDFKILKFQKNLSLQELILSLSEKLGLMKENLAISVQHLAHGQQITEEISNESNLKLSLDELNIYENSILYIEEKKEGKNLNWPEQFEVQQHKINIKFNTPKNQQQQQEQTENEEEDLKRQEFSNNLSIDSRLTVSDLKEQISKKLKIDKNQILMRRGGKQGQEIKEGKPGTLKSQHFFNGSSIYLEYGLPAKEGEVRLCISLAKQADLQNDNIFHEFQEIGEFPIQANLTAFQVGEEICKIIKKNLNLDLDPKFIRLRERVSNRLTKIYRNRPMKDQQIIDKKQISVEKLDFEQNLTQKDVQLYVRIWDQENWKLSDRFELIISKSDSGQELAQQIYSHNQQIQIEDMEATRVTAVWNFNQYDLIGSQFNKVNNPAIMLGSQPFHLMNDGYLLIVKDKNKQPKELSNEELQKMGVTLLSGKGNKSLQMQKMRQQGQSKQGGRQPNLEKELSITVKKKASNKQLQQLENANQKNEEIAQQEQIDGENLDQKQEKNDKFLEQEEKKQNNLNTEKD